MNVMAAHHVTGTWLVIVVKMYIIIHYGITLSLVKYLPTESAIAVQFAIRIAAVAARCRMRPLQRELLGAARCDTSRVCGVSLIP